MLPSSLRTAHGTQWFVGYLDGEPVAASQLEVFGPIAGVNFIGVKEAHRGRGFGEAVTWRVVNAGRDAGCRFAILQASDAGKPVYERMGFRTVTGYRTYARPEFL
jgi:predicted acetyltransferase